MDTEKQLEWVSRCITCGDPFFLSQKEIRRAIAIGYGGTFIVCPGCLGAERGEGVWAPEHSDLRVTCIYRADVSHNIIYMVKERLGIKHKKGDKIRDVFYLPTTWHRFKK